MTRKNLLLTILAGAMLFGIAMSGCKRGNKKQVAMNTRIHTQIRRTQNARPAEVLSASAYRPPEGGTAMLVPVQAAPAPVMMAQMPIPSSPSLFVGPVYTDLSHSRATQIYTPSVYSAPVQSQPYVVHATPDLAMARAGIPQARPAPVAIAAQAYRAPIPELEPVRHQRLPSDRISTRPVAEIMMSARNAAANRNADMRRALAPIGQPQPAQRQQSATKGWIASPTTAMRAY